MRRFYSKVLATFRPQLVVAVFFVSLMTACYEGWDESGGSDKDKSEKGKDAIKPLSYVLFEPMRLSDAAIDDPGCFAPGNEEFRKAEWKSRIESLQAALSAISDTTVSVEREVPTSDCDTLSTIEQAALDAEPWGDDAPGQVEKPIVHIKAVFWDGDVANTPSSRVLNRDWLAFDRLIDSGTTALSVHHFNLANETNGFLKTWRLAVTKSSKNATAIDDVDPTPAGIESRKTIISKDSETFVAWLLEEVKNPQSLLVKQSANTGTSR